MIAPSAGEKTAIPMSTVCRPGTHTWLSVIRSPSPSPSPDQSASRRQPTGFPRGPVQGVALAAPAPRRRAPCRPQIVVLWHDFWVFWHDFTPKSGPGSRILGDRPKPQNSNWTLRCERCRANSPSPRQPGTHGDRSHRSDWGRLWVGISRSAWLAVGSRPGSDGPTAIPGASTSAVFISASSKPQKSSCGSANPSSSNGHRPLRFPPRNSRMFHYNRFRSSISLQPLQIERLLRERPMPRLMHPQHTVPALHGAAGSDCPSQHGGHPPVGHSPVRVKSLTEELLHQRSHRVIPPTGLGIPAPSSLWVLVGCGGVHNPTHEVHPQTIKGLLVESRQVST